MEIKTVYALCPPCDDDYYGLSSPIAIVTSIEEAKKLLQEMYNKEIVIEEKEDEDGDIYLRINHDKPYSGDIFFLIKFKLNKLKENEEK